MAPWPTITELQSSLFVLYFIDKATPDAVLAEQEFTQVNYTQDQPFKFK
jgi:hypothetical protein